LFKRWELDGSLLEMLEASVGSNAKRTQYLSMMFNRLIRTYKFLLLSGVSNTFDLLLFEAGYANSSFGGRYKNLHLFTNDLKCFFFNAVELKL
jgi:hypothetical protein